MIDSKKIAKLVNSISTGRKIVSVVVMAIVFPVVLLNFGVSVDSFISAAIMSFVINFIAGIVLAVSLKNRILGKDVSDDELLDSLTAKREEIVDAMSEIDDQNSGEIKSDYEATPPQQVSLKFRVNSVSENVIGKFKDSDIFAWVDLEDEYGNIHRSVFAGTIDVNNPASTVPKHSFIVMPGIIYQVEGL